MSRRRLLLKSGRHDDIVTDTPQMQLSIYSHARGIVHVYDWYRWILAF